MAVMMIALPAHAKLLKGYVLVNGVQRAAEYTQLTDNTVSVGSGKNACIQQYTSGFLTIPGEYDYVKAIYISTLCLHLHYLRADGTRLTVETIDDSGESTPVIMQPRRQPVEVVRGENGIFTFTMPAAPVTVKATFGQSIITEVDRLNIEQHSGGTRYNLMGQPVGKGYKGIVIENGAKRIIR